MNHLAGQDCVTYGDSRIAYHIVHSPKRKTIGITVYPSGEVRVSVPQRMGNADIRRFVWEKAGWIDRKLRAFEIDGGRDATKKYAIGERFLYLGREYMLRIVEGDHGPLATLDDRHLNVILPPGLPDGDRAEAVKKVVDGWYRFHASMAIDEALMKYSARLGMLPPPYRVKNQSKRWGSCTAKDCLNFNLRIAMAPLPQLEYVVAHELCHVKIKDHSPRYWALVEKVMPGYKAAKKALRKDGWKYEL